MKLMKIITLTFFILMHFTLTIFAVQLDLISTFGTYGETEGELLIPYQITLNENKQIIVIDHKPSIQIFSPEGEFVQSWSNDIPTVLDPREYITVNVDPKGHYYLTFQNAKEVVKYNENKEVEMTWKDSSFSWVKTLVLNPENMYMADNSSLWLLNYQGETIQKLDNIKLWNPTASTIDANGNLYIANDGYRNIKVISPEGTLIREWNDLPINDSIQMHLRNIQFDQKGNLFCLSSIIVDNITYARLRIYSQQGELLQDIQLEKYNSENPDFYPIDFVISEDKLFLLDMAEHLIKTYQINYDDDLD